MTATLRAVLRRCIVVAVLTLVAGCRPPGQTSEPGGDSGPTQAATDTETTSESNDGETTPDGRPKPRCNQDGRVWDGHHPGCLYEVAGCCYDDPAAACNAAGCSDASCRVMEVSPAQIVCEEPASPAQS